MANRLAPVLARLAPVLAAVPAAVLVVAGTVPATAEDDRRVRTRFTWADERIDESSGLAFAGRLLVTTNDSGDDPVLYVVDPRTGETVGTTVYAEPGATFDVEALAPAGPRAVWVADIGDNRAVRDDVVVWRVPVGAGARQVRPPARRYRYPGGPRDAETLLRQPGTGRLFVVTKSFAGGEVYAVPRALRRTVLRLVGTVPGWLTDGAFTARSRVLLRGYGDGTVYSFPALRRLTDVRLPAAGQAEAVAIRSGEAWVSSEGEGTPVHSVRLPQVARGAEPPGSSAFGSPSVTPDEATDPAPSSPPTPERIAQGDVGRSPTAYVPWLLVLALGLAGGGAWWVVATGRRRSH